MSFQAAFSLSVAIHLGLFFLRPPQGIGHPQEVFHPVELTYLPVPPQPIPSPPKTDTTPAAPPPPAPSVPAPSAPPPEKQAPSRPLVGVTSPTPFVPSETYHLPEGEFAALEYKQQVREHLKKYLSFPDPSLQGTVRLRVSMGQEGNLQELQVLESTDANLSELTAQGTRRASPFPRFPKKLTTSKASYEFLVQYKAE